MAEDKNKDDQQLDNHNDDVEETKGGADQSKEDDPGSDGSPDGGASSKQNKTFTQEQVNRMMTREKNQGRAAAMKELGIDPKDTKAVAMVKALIESQKSEEQKAAEKAAADNEKQAEAERRAVVAEVKAEAMMIGAQPQYVDDLVALVMSKMGDDTDVKTVVSEYKTKYPMWFESKDDDKGSGNKKAGQKGTGSSVKGNAGGGKDTDKGKSMGARLAAQRKATSGKHSYWGNKR